MADATSNEQSNEREKAAAAPGSAQAGEKIGKTEAEWRAQLTPEQYAVTREHGTERAFSGAYCDAKDPGLYRCICCNAGLFRSDSKFDSGSGWPSFYEPETPGALREISDESHGMTRTEVRCNRCDAHLGHVFPDGPNPTGLRYCINSLSIDLEKSEER